MKPSPPPILAAALAALAASACLTDEPELGAADDELLLMGNCAMKSNEKGGLDSGVAFASFWSSAQGFTLSSWIMPEFVFANLQPVLGAADSAFWVGPGNFRARWRNANDCNYIPVLTVRVGTRTINYLSPQFVRHTWRHLALTWQPNVGGGNAVVRLYLDGAELMPHQNVGPADPATWTCANVTDGTTAAAVITPADLAGVPAGNLQVGGAQRFFYGLIDHVLVQNDALTAAEVVALKNGGSPAAGTTVWTTSFAGRTECSGPIGYGTARRVEIGARDSGDAALFFDPDLVAPTATTYHLPFAPGEIWRVMQEFDTPGTHNGYAAFCWDFVFTGAGKSPLKIVRAAAAGMMIDVEESDDPPHDGGVSTENQIKIVTASGEMTSHLHLAPGSVSEIFFGGDPPMFMPQHGQFQLPVGSEAELARLGVPNPHLHFALHPTAASYSTSPMAFSNYQVAVSCATGAEIKTAVADIAAHPCWKFVPRGMPRDDTYIRR